MNIRFLGAWLSRALIGVMLANMFAIAPVQAQKVSALPQSTTITGAEAFPCVQGGVTSKCTVAGVRSPSALDFRMLCGNGDSRTNQMQNSNSYYGGFSAQSFITQFNAMQGHPLNLRCSAGVTQVAVSGNRSDQYIQFGGAAAIASQAGWILQGAPCVNDIGQSIPGYTTVTNAASPNSGVAVTISNVAAVCAGNIQAQVTAALASGHKVILEAERGATAETTAQVGAVFEVNQRLRDFCEFTAGCYWFDPNLAVWNSTSSTTAIAFKAGYSSDGTHWTGAGAYAEALEFQRQFGTVFPAADYLNCNVADNPTTNPLQLFPNGLFTTTTGGTFSGAGTLTSGTVPSGWTLDAASGIAITAATAAGACGNDLTFTITASNAGLVRFRAVAPSTSAYSLTDSLQTAMGVSVAGGATNATVYAQTTFSTTDASAANIGQSSYDMYTTLNGPSVAYNYALRTRAIPAATGSVAKAFVQGGLYINFTAAGSATVTVRRASFVRTFAGL